MDKLIDVKNEIFFSRERLDIKKFMLFDTVYHLKYGILSHQPLLRGGSMVKDGKLRMVASNGIKIWISKNDKFWSVTEEEDRKYWVEFHKENDILENLIVKHRLAEVKCPAHVQGRFEELGINDRTWVYKECTVCGDDVKVDIEDADCEIITCDKGSCFRSVVG